MFRFELGGVVKDIVTGFSGVITARAEYLTGCMQYSVTSKTLQSGNVISGWFDEDRLKATGGKKIKLNVKVAGGPQKYTI